MAYVGRFAPSPTGPLHPGSLVAALGSWLDARAHGGRWLVRIEDVDGQRCVAGADRVILDQLAACGLHPDAEVVWQSRRGALYQAALERLATAGLAYPCACSRRDIEQVWQQRGRILQPGDELPYPGSCRTGLHGRQPRAWRLRLPDLPQACTVDWQDLACGPQHEAVDQSVGDFVLKRADGCWAYQLACVVDDGEQGVTDIVRGADLLGSTARQILLQRALGLPTPRYRHLPLLRDADGRKLSKQAGDQPFVAGVGALQNAAAHLGLRVGGDSMDAVLAQALGQWRAHIRGCG